MPRELGYVWIFTTMQFAWHCKFWWLRHLSRLEANMLKAPKWDLIFLLEGFSNGCDVYKDRSTEESMLTTNNVVTSISFYLDLDKTSQFKKTSWSVKNILILKLQSLSSSNFELNQQKKIYVKDHQFIAHLWVQKADIEENLFIHKDVNTDYLEVNIAWVDKFI